MYVLAVFFFSKLLILATLSVYSFPADLPSNNSPALEGWFPHSLALLAPWTLFLRSIQRRGSSHVARSGLERRQAGGDPLFGSKGKQPLTKNGVTMVCARFRKRTGISDPTITPQALRHGFALRYLQTGGNPQGLQELLGYEGSAPVRQYLRWYEQMRREQMQQKDERREEG